MIIVIPFLITEESSTICKPVFGPKIPTCEGIESRNIETGLEKIVPISSERIIPLADISPTARRLLDIVYAAMG